MSIDNDWDRVFLVCDGRHGHHRSKQNMYREQFPEFQIYNNF